MIKRYWITWLTVIVVLICDQLTKYLIYISIDLNHTVTVLPGFFNITHVRNPGAAFGFLAEAPHFLRYTFFTGVSIAAILLILYYLKLQQTNDTLTVLSLSLILAGALGNMIDRVRFGEVIDFMDFHIGNAHWPAFNVADSAISIGAFLLFISLVKGKERNPRPM
ncbi:MAG: signal peptidase II [Syntrophales bacterium]|nr:signal peptidase II [Syntrophales bacterium]